MYNAEKVDEEVGWSWLRRAKLEGSSLDPVDWFSFRMEEGLLHTDPKEEWIREVVEHGAAQTHFMPPHEIAAEVCFCVGWVQNNMPIIELGHKLAASYMMTSSDSVLDTIQLPFPYVRIRIPDRLIVVKNPKGEEMELKTVSLGRVDGGLAVLIRYQVGPDTSTSRSVVESFRDLKGLISEQPSFTKEYRRSLFLLVRLILCVLIRMTGYKRDPTINKALGKKGRKRKKGKAKAEQRVYRIPDKVTHDFRQFVKDYTSGTGKRVTIRSLVTGHWKQQPYGPKRSKRKNIFVEPYWRGPEEGRPAIRPHVLG